MATVTDDFNRTDGPLGANWTKVSGGDFIVESQVAKQAIAGATTNSATYHNSSVADTDHISECDVIALGGVNKWIATLARFEPVAGTGYAGLFFRTGADSYQIHIWTWSGGGITAKIADSGTLTGIPATPFNLKTKVEGNQISVLINEVIVVQTNDDTFTTGEFAGIASSQHNLTLDNFRAADLNATTIVLSASTFQFHQRPETGTYDLPVSGTYTGTPTAIEARWQGGDWIVIDEAPAGGTFSSSIPAQMAGQGLLEVRFANDTNVTDQVMDVSIGDVVIVAGQSNAVGQFQAAQSYSHPSLKAIMLSQGILRELSDPTHAQTSNGSVWPLLASLWMADQDVPVMFIMTAVNGTSLVSGEWSPPGGAQYSAMISAYQTSGVNAVRAILFHQGESDAAAGATQAEYEAALQTFATAAATDFNWMDGTPRIVVAQIGQVSGALAGTTDEEIDAIRKAQASTWDENPHVIEGPVLWHQKPLSDNLHFQNLQEAIELRDQWWASVEAGLFNGTNTAPQATSIEVADNIATLTFDRNLTDPGSNYTTAIFEVTEDGTPITVTSATYVAPHSVRLTLSATPNGELVIKMGSGNMEGVSAVPIVPKSNESFPRAARPILGTTTSSMPSNNTANRLLGGGAFFS